ncbi:amidohydrolase family protein [Dactylosporangium sp. NPDC051541]|uniref:amidohydrolase family protein n=1 Tax=Dactylosporangium sp. NPDC051541 TaxID=3363977 RepID=UPI0037A52364
MTLVDAHHHLWHLGGGYEWLDAPGLAPIRRTFSPADLRAELSATPVTHTVLVEGGRCDPGEAAVLFAHAVATPEIAGVVAWDDPARPGFQAYGDRPGSEYLVGLRAQVQAEDTTYLDRDDVRAGLRAYGRAGLVFDLVIRQDQLPSAARAAAACPDVRFVLDHLGKPHEFAAWRSAVADLSAAPNVLAKLSGLFTEVDDVRPYVETALELFGPARLMWGSDWPVCTLATTYADALHTVQALVPFPEVFTTTAVEAYGLRIGDAGVQSPQGAQWH